jgi:hypothetical protein
VKEETEDVSESFEDFATNQSSTLDENSSDTDQHDFSNSYTNPSVVLTLGGGSLGGDLPAAQMLKRVATRASSSKIIFIFMGKDICYCWQGWAENVACMRER